VEESNGGGDVYDSKKMKHGSWSTDLKTEKLLVLNGCLEPSLMLMGLSTNTRSNSVSKGNHKVLVLIIRTLLLLMPD